MGFPCLAVALWCQASPDLDWSGWFLQELNRSKSVTENKRINLAGAQSRAGHLKEVHVHSHLCNGHVMARRGSLVPLWFGLSWGEGLHR